MAHEVLDGLGAWLVRASVLLACAALAARLLRRASAALRAGVWRAALVGVVALPVLAPVAPQFGWLRAGPFGGDDADRNGELVPSPSSNTRTSAPVLGTRASQPEPAPEVALEQPVTERAHEVARAPMPDETSGVAALSVEPSVAGLVAYSLGAAVGLLALVRGLARAARIVREAAPDGGELEGARVVTSDAPEAPFVLDLRPFARPVLVLARHDDEAARALVRLHEGRHVARCDGAWFLFARLVAALVWPTPLAWFALRRLRRESERAADDAVLCAGVRASDYAAQLLARATRPAALPVPAMAGRGSALSERVEALLAERADRREVRGWTRSIVALSGAALALLLAGQGRASANDSEEPSSHVTLEGPADPERPLAPVGPANSSGEAAEDAPPPPVKVPPAPPDAPAAMPESGALEDDPVTPLGDSRFFAWNRGLAALAAMQDPTTGAWRGDFVAHRIGEWRMVTADAPHVGVTALALEALMLAGQLPGQPPFGDALDRGIAWLVASQVSGGAIQAHGSGLREHMEAVRALGLATVLGAQVPAGALRSAVEHALAASGTDADIVATAHQLHALVPVIERLGVAVLDAHDVFDVVTAVEGNELDRAQRALEASERRIRAWRTPAGGAHPAHAFTLRPDAASPATAEATAAGLSTLRDRAARHETLIALEALLASDPLQAPSSRARWETELLARRAFEHLDIEWEVSQRDPGFEPDEHFRRRQLERVLAAADPSGRWRCPDGPGDAYATAVACLLLANW